MACAIRLRPMESKATCAPAWAFPTPRNDTKRHCEERSDEVIQSCFPALDCFAALAMTEKNHCFNALRKSGYVFVEVRHRCLWRHRIHRSARRRISRRLLPRKGRSEMGDGRAQPGKARIGARRDR